MKKLILKTTLLLISFFIFGELSHAANCHYSLTDINAYKVTTSNGKYVLSKDTENIKYDDETYLDMTVKDEYTIGQQNISFSSYPASVIRYGFDSSLIAKFDAAVKSSISYDGNEGEMLHYFSTCPTITMIFKDATINDKAANKSYNYHQINNITFSGSSLDEDLTVLLSIYTKSVPEGLRLVSLDGTNVDKKNPVNPQPVNPDPQPNDPEPDEPVDPNKDVKVYNHSFDFCSNKNVLKALSIIHTLITIARIIVPLVIIVLATIDFGKAVVASDEKAIQTATNTVIRRLIIGIIIFFIPTLVYAIIHMVDQAKDVTSTFSQCDVCFTGHDKDGKKANCDF